MELTQSEIDTIAEACERFQIAPSQIWHVARNWQPDAEEFARPYMTDEEPRRAIAAALLEKLNPTLLAPEFLMKLYRETAYAPEFRKVVGPVLNALEARAPGHQAFLYRTDNVVAEDDFRKIMDDTGPKVCCLAGKFGGKPSIGTGFLIGPDRVLTAMHVFDIIPEDQRPTQVPEHFRAYFDCDQGRLPGQRGADDQFKGRVVRLSKENWLLAVLCSIVT